MKIRCGFFISLFLSFALHSKVLFCLFVCFNLLIQKFHEKGTKSKKSTEGNQHAGDGRRESIQCSSNMDNFNCKSSLIINRFIPCSFENKSLFVPVKVSPI